PAHDPGRNLSPHHSRPGQIGTDAGPHPRHSRSNQRRHAGTLEHSSPSSIPHDYAPAASRRPPTARRQSPGVSLLPPAGLSDSRTNRPSPDAHHSARHSRKSFERRRPVANLGRLVDNSALESR